MQKLRFVAIAVVCAIAGSVSGSASAITFGEADRERHPQVGALVADWNEDSPGPDQFCSGTLVDETLFLTAAHCMAGWAEDQEFWVSFEEVYDEDAASPSGLHEVVDFTLHEGFGHDMADLHDLAIVELATAPDVEPADLPELGLFDSFSQQELRDLTFTTVGYGLVRESKKGGPNAFIDETNRLVAQQSFLSLQPAWLNLNMNPSTGSGGTCFGDSGGPNFVGSSLVVGGVTSYGLNGNCAGTGGVYRVDKADDLNWLKTFGLG
jgi:secreted trypsin-like serine protease